ncbi:MAG TPA: hypothetical protein VGR85_09000 [Candidatus Limnocylindria bacterium]|jgi:hypothetical protein|nr:hypothetical protein [Candidatus Limnocylindria bacterium]
MAVVPLNAAQQIVENGIVPAYQSGILATDTFTFPNDGKVFLHVKHGAGGSNLTLVTAKLYRGRAVADSVIAIGANSEAMIGPFPTELYNDDTGKITGSISEATGFTVAVLRAA